MNKFLFVSAAIVTSTVFAQAAFAETNLQLSKGDLIAASQGYNLTDSSERPQARRSALFARILDSKKDGVTTLAKSKPKPSLVVSQGTTDAKKFVYSGAYATTDSSTFVYPGASAKTDASAFVYSGS